MNTIGSLKAKRSLDLSNYRSGSLNISSDAADFQRTLEKAHADKQRLRCLCVEAQPEMYVAKLDQYVLKRMPGTGHLHDPGCKSFDPPPEISGLGQVNGKAIVTDEQGETRLNLDFPLSMRSKRAAPVADTTNTATSAIAPPQRLSLLALLHYLWDEAELTKWRPGFRGKRGWWRVHNELMEVAQRASTKAGQLAGTLFVPPPFTVEKKDELAAARRKFMHPLHPVKGKPIPLGLIVAEYKSDEPTQYGRRIRFKHLPDFAFFMDGPLCARFDKLHGEKIQTVEAVEGSHLIMIATFNLNGNYAEIREIAAMPVTADWLPFDSDRELRLIEALIERPFSKSLKYNLAEGAPVANALLVDTEPPTALFCGVEGGGSAYDEELQEIADQGVFPAWVWRSSEAQLPDLPQPASR